MAKEGEVSEETVEELAAEADRGRKFLDVLDLPEAEEIFRDILQRLPTYRSVRGDQVIVSSLFGLAEIHAKHCRSITEKELDWLCGMLFALLFYRAATEVCGKVVRHRRANGEQPMRNGSAPAKRNGSASSRRNGSSNGDYFSDTMSRAKTQANAIEVNLLEAMRGRIVENCTFLHHFRPITNRGKSKFDDAWLDGLWKFCSRSAAEYHNDGDAAADTDDHVFSEAETPDTRNFVRRRRFSLVAKDVPPLRITAPDVVQKECPSSPSTSSVKDLAIKRRINFDRFQDAIKQFVGDVSRDIRTQYSHISGKIPHGLLEHRVCSELALRFSSDRDESQELESIYRTLMNEDDSMSVIAETEDEDLEDLSDGGEDTEDEAEEDDDTIETIDLHIKPSAAHSGRRKTAEESTCNGVVVFDKTSKVQETSALVPANNERKQPAVVQGRNQNESNAPSVKTTSGSTKTKNESDVNTVSDNRGNTANGKGVLTKWRHGESTKAFDETSGLLNYFVTVRGFEEVSQFTEKKEKCPKNNSDSESETGLQRYINESKLSQLLALTAVRLADAFKKETRLMEARQMYKYAYGILKAYPLVGGQLEMLARLLVDIGNTCCSMGELEYGSELMKEAAVLYESCGEPLKVADVWYQLGNVYLSDGLRQESLLARVMQMIKEEVQEENIEDDRSSITDDDDSSSSQGDETYCTCIYEAVDCFKKALEVMEKARDQGQGQDPDLMANLLSNLGDCRVMTGNLEESETSYEEAQSLFTSTYGTPLLHKNAHVLCMVGTLSFLTRNFVRAATMYETSYILRQHLPEIDEPTLEMAWSLTMLGLSYHSLGNYPQAVTWCIRAFKLYTGFFRGRLLFVDSLNRWFIVQNLLIIGFAYITLSLYKKALHYLHFCRNMIAEAEDDQEPEQSIRVLLALGDAHTAVEEVDTATKYYNDAQERLNTLRKDSPTTAWLSNEIQARLTGNGSTTKSTVITRDGVIHDQAVVRQRSVESSIKEDMVVILLKLGFTTTAQKDIDWAIGCYNDCVQGYRDLQEPSEAARALSSLGTLCHIKGRLQSDDGKQKQEFLNKAEQYFKEAHSMVDTTSPVCVQYGSFLYSEGRYQEALEVLLPFVFCNRSENIEIYYSGIEQMALPPHLRHNIEEEETLIVEARVLAKFLGLLCFQSLKMTREADDALVQLYHSVAGSTNPLNYLFLGYAFLETDLYPEAADSFMWSSRLQPESDLAYSNALISLLLAAYSALARGVDYLLQYVLQPGRNDRGAITFQEKKSYLRRQVSLKARKRPGTETQPRPSTDQVSTDEASQRNQGYTQRQELQSGDVSFKEHITYPNDQTPEAGSRMWTRSTPTNMVATKPTSPTSRNVVIETRRWPTEQPSSAASSVRQDQQPDRLRGDQEETGMRGEAGTRKKWRSRLYHNLPESPDTELLQTPEARRPRVE